MADNEWSMYQWVWRLESPLFLGMPPAGSLNRCRLYVSARVIHGAVAAELARGKSEESFPDYGKLGHEVGLRCRFTYLYPAERTENGYKVWLPEYKEKMGMTWGIRSATEEEMFPEERERRFKRRLLDSRPGTAVQPETDTAFEGSLRETECIHMWWREASVKSLEPIPVFFAGIYISETECV